MRRCVTWTTRASQPRSQSERARSRSASGGPAATLGKTRRLPTARFRFATCPFCMRARPPDPAKHHLSTLVNQPSPRTGIPALRQRRRSDPPAQHQLSPLHRETCWARRDHSRTPRHSWSRGPARDSAFTPPTQPDPARHQPGDRAIPEAQMGTEASRQFADLVQYGGGAHRRKVVAVWVCL